MNRGLPLASTLLSGTLPGDLNTRSHPAEGLPGRKALGVSRQISA